MKKNFLTTIKSVSSVLVIASLLTACTTDLSLTKNDFYNKRIVNKKETRDVVARLPHRHLTRGITNKSGSEIANRYETSANIETDISLVDLVTSNEPGIESKADIASIDNKILVESNNYRLSKKINTLYTSGSDVRSFRKGYKEIKKERITEFKKIERRDDPLTQQAPVDKRTGLSIASFVLGIVGFFVFGIICGILAIVMGGIGMKRGRRGLAIAGMILGIIDVIGVIIVLGVM